jgi:PAS domain S-box-containing protein
MPFSLTYALLGSVVAREGMIDAIPYPIFVKDADSRLVAVNTSMCKLMGRDAKEMVGKTDYEFVPKEQADVFRAKDVLVLETGEPNENEEMVSGSDGHLHHIITRKHRVLLPGGARYIVGCITDITELRQSEKHSHRRGKRQSLASLRNRLLFERALEEARAAALQLALRCFDPARSGARASLGRQQVPS